MHDGKYMPTAVFLMLGAGVLVGVAVRRKQPVSVWWLLGPIAILLLHGALAPVRPPALDVVPRALTLVPLATLVLGCSYLVPLHPRWSTARFAILCALAAWLAIAICSVSPHPREDVYELQTRGADDLLAGRDPYSTVSVMDTNAPELTVPYTYPPVQLLVTTLARATTGDVRFAMALMLILAALGARMALRGGDDLLRDSIALIVVGGPITAFVLERALVDVVPLGLAGAALWAWTSEKRTIGAVLFGVTFAAKQPLVIGFPMLLLLPGFGKKQFAVAFGVAATVTLPFFAWDPGAFLHGTVRYFIDLAPREDALTVTNLLLRRFGRAPGGLLGVSAALLICAMLWRRSERRLSSMLGLLTIALLCLFSTGKIAFINYYFLLSGLAAMTAIQLAAES